MSAPCASPSTPITVAAVGASRMSAAAVVLGADQDEGAAPQAARDLDVPVVPALVGDDKIFLRREEAHEAAEQHLLLVAAVAPIGEIEGALAPGEARRLARLR